MKKFIPVSLLISFLFPFSIFAQVQESEGAHINFSVTTHDFGKIEELGGVINVDFNFTNEGTAPLFLKKVEASCGCTTPLWTTDSIMPGEEGFIQVAFDPTNRPGPFNKTVTVTSNGTPAVSVLSIEGMVIPTPNNLSDQYPYKMGGLRFREKNLHFGNITNEKPVTQSFEAFNDTDEIIAFSGNSLKPQHITITYEPQAINPGQVGLVHLTYAPQELGTLGYTIDNVTLYTYELEDSIKQFNVYATILEYFPPIAKEEMSSLPKVDVDKTIEDFGHTNKNTTLDTDFIITNKGKEPLQLKKITTNCPCVIAQADKTMLQAGESAVVKVAFEVEPTPGTQQKAISIFTNDPKNHVQVLTLKAYIRD